MNTIKQTLLSLCLAASLQATTQRVIVVSEAFFGEVGIQERIQPLLNNGWKIVHLVSVRNNLVFVLEASLASNLSPRALERQQKLFNPPVEKP